MRIALTVSVFIAIGFGCERAEAANRCSKGASRVEVSIDGGSPDLARSIHDELAIELARAKLCINGSGDTNPPLAHIGIILDNDEQASVRIVDAVTKKTVERQVSVAGLPVDGRALPIAIAADELLRASWAEITLHSDDTAPSQAVPKVVRESIERPRSLAPKAFARSNELGLAVTSGLYGGGQTQFGGLLFYRRDFVPWLSATLFGFARDSLTVHAADGAIRAYTLGGGLALEAYVARVGRIRLGPELGADIGYAQFQGVASAPAKGTKFTSYESFGSLGLALAIDLSPIRLSASALGLAPFHTAVAVDGTKVVTGMSGAGFLASLGAGAAF